MDEVEQRHEQEFEKVCDEKFLGSQAVMWVQTVDHRKKEWRDDREDPDSD